MTSQSLGVMIERQELLEQLQQFLDQLETELLVIFYSQQFDWLRHIEQLIRTLQYSTTLQLIELTEQEPEICLQQLMTLKRFEPMLSIWII